MFCLGGKKPISSFFFPPPISFTQPPPPSESFVLGSVSCFCAVWFRFLGLSCSVVVFQTHCDLTASVPVPTTIWKGGRGPTAGMLGQKVTSQAQRLKGGAETDGRRSEPGSSVWGEQPNLPDLTGQPSFTQIWCLSPVRWPWWKGTQAHSCPLPQHETTSYPPKQPQKTSFETQLNSRLAF